MPVIDKSQDWVLEESNRNSSHITLQFFRPYKTCDSIEDIELYDFTPFTNIIWSYSHRIPQNLECVHKHDYKGIEHVNLFDLTPKFIPKETDIKAYDFVYENVSIIFKFITCFYKIESK